MIELDEFDVAMGELLHLFSEARWRQVLPHQLNPVLFYDAWTVLNAQPFPVRQAAFQVLMDVWGDAVRMGTKAPVRYS